MSDDVADVIEATVPGDHVTRLVGSENTDTFYRWGYRCRCGVETPKVYLLADAVYMARGHVAPQGASDE